MKTIRSVSSIRRLMQVTCKIGLALIATVAVICTSSCNGSKAVPDETKTGSTDVPMFVTMQVMGLDGRAVHAQDVTRLADILAAACRDRKIGVSKVQNDMLRFELLADSPEDAIIKLRHAVGPTLLSPMAVFVVPWKDKDSRGDYSIGSQCVFPMPEDGDFQFHEQYAHRPDAIKAVSRVAKGQCRIQYTLTLSDADALRQFLDDHAQSEYAMICGFWGTLGPVAIREVGPMEFEFSIGSDDGKALRSMLMALNGGSFGYRCISVVE
jgi:hypothetical protein